MVRIKFSELAKQTMTPKSIARSRKTAINQIAEMELSKKARPHKARAPKVPAPHSQSA
jgi:hypothetical protein